MSETEQLHALGHEVSPGTFPFYSALSIRQRAVPGPPSCTVRAMPQSPLPLQMQLLILKAFLHSVLVQPEQSPAASLLQ